MEQLIHIDPGGAPIYEQLFAQVVQLTASGVLEQGQQLVSVRTLAKALGVNPNTVQKAYADLERSGIIYTVAGKGSFVAAPAAARENLLSDAKIRLAEAVRGCRGAGMLWEELTEYAQLIFEESEEVAR